MHLGENMLIVTLLCLTQIFNQVLILSEISRNKVVEFIIVGKSKVVLLLELFSMQLRLQALLLLQGYAGDSVE